MTYNKKYLTKRGYYIEKSKQYYQDHKEDPEFKKKKLAYQKQWENGNARRREYKKLWARLKKKELPFNVLRRYMSKWYHHTMKECEIIEIDSDKMNGKKTFFCKTHQIEICRCGFEYGHHEFYLTSFHKNIK